MELLNEIWDAIEETSITEWVAVVFGLTYLILITLRNRLGWWFALISSSLYVYLAFSVFLYIESALQLFYVGMAVYGWMTWTKAQTEETFIIRWKVKNHLIGIGIGALVSLLLGFVMNQFTNQATPYLNAFTTVFSLLATYLTAHRILENWLYWIVIDSAIVVLYYNQNLKLISLTYLIYTIIAIFAYFSWSKSYKTQK